MDFGKITPGSLPNAPNIPIIGEAFSVLSWYPTILGLCGACKVPVIVVGGHGPGVCTKCHKAYDLQTMQMNGPNVQFGFAVGLPTGSGSKVDES